MTTTAQSTGYALLIGVDDYSAYDQSVNDGASNSLRGSLNDVRAWYKLCRELGYPAENIRVLTSPAIARPELEGATVGPATKDAINDGVAWLTDKLGAPDKPAGVLTFSGHGGMSVEGLILCPTNVMQEGGKIVNAVHLVEIEAMIASKKAGRNLTSIFDCCRACRGQHVSDEPASLQRVLRASNERIIAPAIGDRVFFGAEPRTAGYQAELGGRWHGAFTWAFMTIKSQWTIVNGPNGGRELNISYENMRLRTEQLLASLAFEQVPALVCRQSALEISVFHRGPASDDDTASGAATAERSTIQLDPSTATTGYRLYEWKNSSGTIIANTIVPASNSPIYGRGSTPTYVTGNEYWQILTSSVTAPATMTWSDSNTTWPSSNPLSSLSFTNPRVPTWSTNQNAHLNNLEQIGSTSLYVVWNVNNSSGTLTWASTTSQTSTSRFFSNTASGGYSLTGNATLPNNYNKYIGGY